MVVRVVGFDPQCDPAQPGSRAPGAPHPPCAPLLLSLSHLDFPRSNLSLPLPSISPCGALGLGDSDHRNLDPEVSSPPLPYPLSPSPSSLPLRVPPLLSPAAALGPSPSLPVRPGPSPAALGPPLLPGPPARPCAGAARRGRVPGASATRRGRGPCVARGLCAGAARRVASAPATRLRPLRAASTPRRATVLAPLRRVRISD
jgi:hypothetical protein